MDLARFAQLREPGFNGEGPRVDPTARRKWRNPGAQLRVSKPDAKETRPVLEPGKRGPRPRRAEEKRIVRAKGLID